MRGLLFAADPNKIPSMQLSVEDIVGSIVEQITTAGKLRVIEACVTGIQDMDVDNPVIANLIDRLFAELMKVP